MSSVTYERIRNNPKFTELVERRGRFAWRLSGIVFVIFYGFVMAVAFAPDLVSMRPIADSNLTVAFSLGCSSLSLSGSWRWSMCAAPMASSMT